MPLNETEANIRCRKINNALLHRDENNVGSVELFVNLIQSATSFFPFLYMIDIQPITNTYQTALQNGPFRNAKRTVSQAEMDRFACSNGMYWKAVNIFQIKCRAGNSVQLLNRHLPCNIPRHVVSYHVGIGIERLQEHEFSHCGLNGDVVTA